MQQRGASAGRGVGEKEEYRAFDWPLCTNIILLIDAMHPFQADRPTREPPNRSPAF